MVQKKLDTLKGDDFENAVRTLFKGKGNLSEVTNIDLKKLGNEELRTLNRIVFNEVSLYQSTRVSPSYVKDLEDNMGITPSAREEGKYTSRNEKSDPREEVTRGLNKKLTAEIKLRGLVKEHGDDQSPHEKEHDLGRGYTH